MEIETAGLTYLGEGKHRRTYVHPDDETLVIKVIKTDRSKNLDEFRNCRLINRSGMGHWIAQVIELLDGGNVLVMERVVPLTRPPDEIPKFFRDTRVSNWGLLNGRPVCHDYTDIHEISQDMMTPVWKP